MNQAFNVMNRNEKEQDFILYLADIFYDLHAFMKSAEVRIVTFSTFFASNQRRCKEMDIKACGVEHISLKIVHYVDICDSCLRFSL